MPGIPRVYIGCIYPGGVYQVCTMVVYTRWCIPRCVVHPMVHPGIPSCIHPMYTLVYPPCILPCIPPYYTLGIPPSRYRTWPSWLRGHRDNDARWACPGL